jgi:polysaccharide biosynthesis/export protein ExoF
VVKGTGVKQPRTPAKSVTGARTMVQRQESVGSLDDLGIARASHPVGWRSLSRFTPKWPVYLVLGVGVAVAVSPTPVLREAVQRFSDAGKHLLWTPPWRSGSHPLDGEASTGGRASGEPLPPATTADIKLGEVVSYGDRLKITFFETGGVNLASGEANSDGGVAVVFPRMDLSAEYTVDDSGGLDIPKLGRVTAAGKPAMALKSELATAFQRAVGRTSDVHVAIAGRLPVYVAGAVRAPGAFKYESGMFAMQAVTGAGGVDRGVSDTSKVIENIRETGRLQSTKSKLDRLQVKQARLLAQRANAESISLPPSIVSRRSVSGAYDQLDSSIIDAAETSLKAGQQNYRDEMVLADRQIEVVKLEINAQKLRIEQASVLLIKKTRKLQELQDLAQRGSIPQHRIIDMEIEIGELMARREDFRVGFAQTQRRLVEQEAARVKLERDHVISIETELSATQEEMQTLHYEMASAQAVIEALQNSTQNSTRVVSGAGGTPRLSITRRAAGQFVVAPADETTALLPGDVVEVDISSPPPKNAQHLARTQD